MVIFMKKLLKYMSDYKLECILGPLFKLLEASFELMVPLVMASVIDVGIKAGDKGYIYRMCLLLIALGAVGLVCALTAQFFAAKASVGFTAKVRHAVFEHIQSQSFTELDETGPSTLMTRMTSDINQVQNGVNLTLRLLLRSPLVVFGAMVMAFTIDFKAALVFAAIIPILGAVVFAVMLWTLPRYKQVQSRLDRVLGVVRENLAGVRVIRAFGKEENEIVRFGEENRDLTHLQIFVGRVSALMNPMTFILINLATLVLIWVGAVRVNNAVLSQGQVVALINYMALILTELIKLADLIINISRALACAARVQSVLEISPSLTTPERGEAGTLDGSVTFENVSFTYKGAGAPSLENISLTVRPGETVGIIGGTGSGKSTLVNLIPRFYDVTGGTVKVGGQNVKAWPLEALRQQIGMVPQHAELFTGTVRENLCWGKKDAADEALLEALSAAQAKDFITALPGGLDAPVAQGGRNFSGGQRQRLTVARALVRQPKILILDDSMSALDLVTESNLREALKALPQKPTVFLISQRAASLLHCDQILVLEDGEPVGLGKHEELLKGCRVYQEIYQSQFGEEEPA